MNTIPRPLANISLRLLPGLLLCALAGCTTSQAPVQAPSAAAPSRLALRVGISPTLPPLIFKQAGKISGVEAELARGLATDLSRTLQFVELPWEQLIPALLEGKIDIIMSGTSITQQRQVRIDFTRPYFRAGQMALVRRQDVGKLQLFLSAPDTRVGYVKGTTGEFLVLQNMLRNKKTIYGDVRDGAAAVASNKIDAFIYDAPVVWWLASENESKGLTVLSGVLTEEMLAWGVRKGDDTLLQAANAYLVKQQTNGELRRITSRWLPQFSSQ